MVTEQEVEELKSVETEEPWKHLVQIQRRKTPVVVKRTAELLAEVGHEVKGNRLKGQ